MWPDIKKMMVIVSPHFSVICSPVWRASLSGQQQETQGCCHLAISSLGTKIFLDFFLILNPELSCETGGNDNTRYQLLCTGDAGGCLSNFRITTLCPVHSQGSENRFRQNKWWNEASSLTDPGLSWETTCRNLWVRAELGGHLLTVFQTPLWQSWSTLLTNRQTLQHTVIFRTLLSNSAMGGGGCHGTIHPYPWYWYFYWI